jgi:hypothetical protein
VLVPIDKVIKMMLIQKEADWKERKLKVQAHEIEAEEHRAELRQSREENRTFMQMLMLNMVHANNNINNNTTSFPPSSVILDLPQKRAYSVLLEGNTKTIVLVVDLPRIDDNVNMKLSAIVTKKRKVINNFDSSDNKKLLEQMEASLGTTIQTQTTSAMTVAVMCNNDIAVAAEHTEDNEETNKSSKNLHKV